jgi:hypothetical protein
MRQSHQLARCNAPEGNPLGKVLSGYLKLRGKLLVGKARPLLKSPDGWFFIPKNRRIVDNGTSMSISLEWLKSNRRCHILCPRPPSLIGRIMLDTTEEHVAVQNGTVYCFEIFLSYRNFAEQCIHSTALVLQQSPSDKTVFQRVGLAEPLPRHWFEGVSSTEITII